MGDVEPAHVLAALAFEALGVARSSVDTFNCPLL